MALNVKHVHFSFTFSLSQSFFSFVSFLELFFGLYVCSTLTFTAVGREKKNEESGGPWQIRKEEKLKRQWCDDNA